MPRVFTLVRTRFGRPHFTSQQLHHRPGPSAPAPSRSATCLKTLAQAPPASRQLLVHRRAHLLEALLVVGLQREQALLDGVAHVEQAALVGVGTGAAARPGASRVAGVRAASAARRAERGDHLLALVPLAPVGDLVAPVRARPLASRAIARRSFRRPRAEAEHGQPEQRPSRSSVVIVAAARARRRSATRTSGAADDAFSCAHPEAGRS